MFQPSQLLLIVLHQSWLVFSQVTMFLTCFFFFSSLALYFLTGGFAAFSSCFPGLCEGKPVTTLPMSLSQPCLPVANVGPTRILPHLYLGSQKDVLNKVSQSISVVGRLWKFSPIQVIEQSSSLNLWFEIFCHWFEGLHLFNSWSLTPLVAWTSNYKTSCLMCHLSIDQEFVLCGF